MRVSGKEISSRTTALFTWRQFRILSSYLSRGMGMEAKHGMDKGNVFKMFFYGWERGIMWYPQGESKELFACFLKEQRIQCSSVARNREGTWGQVKA